MFLFQKLIKRQLTQRKQFSQVTLLLETEAIYLLPTHKKSQVTEGVRHKSILSPRCQTGVLLNSPQPQWHYAEKNWCKHKKKEKITPIVSFLHVYLLYYCLTEWPSLYLRALCNTRIHETSKNCASTKSESYLEPRETSGKKFILDVLLDAEYAFENASLKNKPKSYRFSYLIILNSQLTKRNQW